MKKLIKSFRFAFEGIFHAVKTERNFKFHLIASRYRIHFRIINGFNSY